MTSKSIPRWKLERFVLGELPEKERAAIERRIGECPETARAVEEIRRSDVELRRRLPADEILPEILKAEAGERERTAPAPPRRRFLKFLIPAAPLVAAATFLLVVMLRETPENRIKGGSTDSGQAKLEVYRKAGPSVEMLEAGDAVRAGDLLQIAYFPAGKPFGVIASLDGRGAVTLHFPDSETDSTRLAVGPRVKLETSYELDDAPEYECFYFITAAAEIDIRGALSRISASERVRSGSGERRLDLPPDWNLFAVCFRKGRLP
jgi:hypothetical protein